MKNILEYLEHSAARMPEKVAFADGETSLTFEAVLREAKAVGSALLRRGITGRPVALLMKRQPETIAAFFGCLYGGCSYVPLDIQMPLSRIRQILSTMQPAAIICQRGTASMAEALPGEILLYDTLKSCPVEEAALLQVRENQIDLDPVYTVFTSGSTGVPKGVTGCHRAVLDYIENLCPVLGFDENTVFGSQAPLYFDACLKEIMPTLKFGATTHLIPKQLFLFPVPLVEYLNTHRINTLCWAVSALTMISGTGTLEEVKPEYLRTVAFAGEVMPPKQLRLWQRALPGVRFFNLYGPTEATGICCYYQVDREFADQEAIPVGRPFPNTRVLLINGEICIQGSRLTLGYYREPEKTAESFSQNPLHDLYPDRIYHTGDLGAYNEQGQLLFLGRKDCQIKHMGHRIELGEIEAAAACCDGVREAAAGYEEGRILLFYAGTAAEGEVSGHLQSLLPRYMLPEYYECLSVLPRTPNGKLNRLALKPGKEILP